MFVTSLVPLMCPRSDVVLQILPPPGVSLEAHFSRLAELNPWGKFEERVVMGYLSAVVSTQSQPVLTQVIIHLNPHLFWTNTAQLENGKLNGFNDIDIQDLLAMAGVELR